MSITTIIGPMFSGKTTELLRLIERERIAGKKCVIIKHAIDNRYVDFINTTNKCQGIYHVTTHGEICYYKCDIIYMSTISNNDFADLLIDKNFCNKLADAGIIVIVSTLDTS